MPQAHVIPEGPLASDPARTIAIVGSNPVSLGLARSARGSGFDVRIVQYGEYGAPPASQVRPIQMTSIDELVGASLAIEATGSDPETKMRALSELDATVGRDCVVLTHIERISVTKLAAATAHPARVVGLHLADGAARSGVVEVVRALQTSDAAHEVACRFIRSLGKTPVATKDQPGFLVYRLMIPLLNEACFALQEDLGTVDDVDAAARFGSAEPGPLRMADAIGLDHCLEMAERLQRELGDGKYRPAALLRNYVAAGWLGRKTGRGFYVYP